MIESRGRVFDDPNLQLAVLEAACVRELVPWFDKPQFFARTLGEPWDDAAPYNESVHPGVRDHLLDVDVAPHLGAILSIDWDATAEVIYSTWSNWDRDDRTFHIRSLEGIELLTRLRRFRCALCAFEDLAPLVQLPELEEIVLVGATIHALTDFARMPALERVDLRACRYVHRGRVPLEAETLRSLGIELTFDGSMAPPPRPSRRPRRATTRSVMPAEERRSTRPPKIVDRELPIPATPAASLVERIEGRIPDIARALSVDITGEPQITRRRDDTKLGYTRVRESVLEAASMRVWTQLVREFRSLRELSAVTVTIEIKTGAPRMRTLRLKLYRNDGGHMVDNLALSASGLEPSEIRQLLAALGMPAV